MHLANQSCDKIALKHTQFKKNLKNYFRKELCIEKKGLRDKFSDFHKYTYLAFNIEFSFDFLQDF